jgi:hypothetical protein
MASKKKITSKKKIIGEVFAAITGGDKKSKGRFAAKTEAPKTQQPAKTKPPKAPAQPKPSKPSTKYQPVEPNPQPDPALADIEFPTGAGLTGSFAVEKGVPIVGRKPFLAKHTKGYSGLAGSVPANRVAVVAQPFTQKAARQTATPAEIAREVNSLIPLIGDKKRGADEILSVAGQPQAGPVRTYAGPDFPLIQMANKDPAVWASTLARLSEINNKARAAEELYGGRVGGAYVTMAPTSADQTVSMIELIGKQLAAGNPNPDAVKELDRLIRAGGVGIKATPDFVGFSDDPLRAVEQLNDINKIAMDQRSAVVHHLDAKKFLSEGLPDVGANRVALTTPELLYAPEGAAGHMISIIDTKRGILPDEDVLNPHPNYPKKLGGVYLGGLEASVPREIMFSRWHKAMKERGYDPFRMGYLIGRPPEGQLLIQPTDQEWVDTVSEYLEKIKNYGPDAFAVGGTVKRKKRFKVKGKKR